MHQYFYESFWGFSYPYLIIGWEDEVLGPGGIWGRVQGVGSDHWGTSSQP